MNAPRITIFHQALLRAGGMEHYAICIARAFIELGCDVTFFARKSDPQLAKELGIGLTETTWPWVPQKLRDWQFARKVSKASRVTPGIQIALSRVPVRDLVICGGTHKGYLCAIGKRPGFFDRLQVRLESAAYAAAARVISHSDLCSRELNQLYQVPAAKIATIYPPVDSRFSPGEVEAAREVLGLPKKKTVLLFPSMGHKRKGLPALCEALKAYSQEVVLAVAGRPAGITGCSYLVPLGYVRDIETAYRAADFTILGSLYEPFGLVGPESVLCGTRLLFEERIGCLPAIEKEAAITFRIEDVHSIRAAVAEALRLKAAGTHRIKAPKQALRYDPDPVEHARALLRCAGVSV